VDVGDVALLRARVRPTGSGPIGAAAWRAHDPPGHEVVDGGRFQPDLFQDLAGVLAPFGRAPGQASVEAGDGDRLTYQVDEPPTWMFHALGELQMPHLRIVEDLVHAVDEPAGHADGVQRLDPVGAWPEADDLLDGEVQGRPRGAFV